MFQGQSESPSRHKVGKVLFLTFGQSQQASPVDVMQLVFIEEALQEAIVYIRLRKLLPFQPV